MNAYKEAATKILRQNEDGLSVLQITKLALEKGLLVTGSKRPENTMSAVITVDIKLNGDNATFKRNDKGLYILNDDVKISKTDKAAKQLQKLEAKEKLESGYTGKGGEHLVCSKLLFLGFNASIMSVDVGLDIVATKKAKFYGIQVKTSNLNKVNTYPFTIRKASFDRYNESNVFYVFVLHGDSSDNYMILPAHVVEKLVTEKYIFTMKDKSRYAVAIKFNEEKPYIGKKENDMSYYLNKWDLIK